MKSTRGEPIKFGPKNNNDVVWFEVQSRYCEKCSLTFGDIPGHPGLEKTITKGLATNLLDQVAGKKNEETKGVVDEMTKRITAAALKTSLGKQNKPRGRKTRLEDPLTKWQRDGPRVGFR